MNFCSYLVQSLQLICDSKIRLCGMRAYPGVAMNLELWRAFNVGWAAKPSKNLPQPNSLKHMLGLAAQPTLGRVLPIMPNQLLSCGVHGERSEAISSFDRGMLRLLQCVRNDETLASLGIVRLCPSTGSGRTDLMTILDIKYGESK